MTEKRLKQIQDMAVALERAELRGEIVLEWLHPSVKYDLNSIIRAVEYNGKMAAHFANEFLNLEEEAG